MALDAHIQSLEQKHKELEEKLADLSIRPSSSDVEITDVKRQKLQLKDQISRLRAEAA